MGEEKNLMEAGKKKLNVKEILLKTIAIYKDGFRQYIGLSAICLITILLSSAAQVLAMFSLTLALLALALSIVSIFFTLRANVSMYKLTESMLQGTYTTLKESYSRSKGMAGTYFVVSLLFGFIIVIPIIAVGLSYGFVENQLLKWMLIAAFGAPLVFLFTRYYLAIPSALLSARQNGEFKSSKELVKGDFWRVLIVILITYGTFTLVPNILGALTKTDSPEVRTAVAIAAIDCFIYVLSAPIAVIGSALMYFDLNERKGIDELLPKNDPAKQCDDN